MQYFTDAEPLFDGACRLYKAWRGGRGAERDRKVGIMRALYGGRFIKPVGCLKKIHQQTNTFHAPLPTHPPSSPPTPAPTQSRQCKLPLKVSDGQSQRCAGKQKQSHHTAPGVKTSRTTLNCLHAGRDIEKTTKSKIIFMVKAQTAIPRLVSTSLGASKPERF